MLLFPFANLNALYTLHKTSCPETQAETYILNDLFFHLTFLRNRVIYTHCKEDELMKNTLEELWYGNIIFWVLIAVDFMCQKCQILYLSTVLI